MIDKWINDTLKLFDSFDKKGYLIIGAIILFIIIVWGLLK